MTDIWTCKIGEIEREVLNARYGQGADFPMRAAVTAMYRELAGCEPNFCFSGWGGKLTEMQRQIVDGDKRRAELRRAEGLESTAQKLLRDARAIRDVVEGTPVD